MEATIAATVLSRAVGESYQFSHRLAKPGDARFDLVTLALTVLDGNHDRSVVDRLHADAIAPLDDAASAGFIGHMILRLLSWTIHRGADDETRFWLDQVDRLF